MQEALPARGAEGAVEVVVDFLAFKVLGILILRKVAYLGHVEELHEDALLKGGGTLQQTGQVLQGVEPLVEERLQLVLPLLKLGHLQIDVRQVVVEHLLLLNVHQLNHMVVVLFVVLVLVEHKVEDADSVDSLQAEAPAALHALLADGERRVVDAAVLEVLLVGLLHLDNYPVALLVLTVHVEHGAAVVLRVAKLFGGQQRQALDDLAPLKQRIQQAKRELLVGLGAKQVLETVVGVGVDVSSFSLVNHSRTFCLQSYEKMREEQKKNRFFSTMT